MDKAIDGRKAARRPPAIFLKGLLVHPSWVGLLAGLCALGLLAGCAAPGPRSRYLEQIESATQTNLLAYRLGANLDIRIPLRGRDAFAHASWAGREDGSTNYQRRLAVLDFDQEKRAARKSITTRTNRLVVHSLQQWQQLLQQVFAGLTPAQPEHAVVLLIKNEEIALFHDTAGKPRVVKLENKPPGVVVDRTCNEADFAHEALRLLDADVSSIDPKQTQFFFVTG